MKGQISGFKILQTNNLYLIVIDLQLYILFNLIYKLYILITFITNSKINPSSNQKPTQKSVPTQQISTRQHSSMQPRILVREQGQNKKRFISPTEVKNNQAIYGDPLGGSKTVGNTHALPMNSQRMYSAENRRSIIEIERQQSQKNIGTKTQQTQKIGQVQRMRSIGQNPKQQPNLPSAKSTSRSKLTPQITKKDYMMSTLAKLNRHKTRQSDEQSNGSQSRSKINSIKNQKQKKQATEEEYTKNVYNQKQKEVKRRPRNTQSQSQASEGESQDGFGLQRDKRSEVYRSTEGIRQNASNEVKIDLGNRKSPQSTQVKKDSEYPQPPMSPTIRPNMNSTKGVQQSLSTQNTQRNTQQNSLRQNDQKLNDPLSIQPVQKPSSQPQFVKRPSTQQQYNAQQRPLLSPRQHSSNAPYSASHQQKISLTSAQESRTYEQARSHIQDSNNSSLVVHLKKAHQEKDELIQKKIQAQKQRNQLKLKLDHQEQLIIQLRTQLEHSQVQNLSLNSELKSIRQTQSRTRTQMQDTNDRNEHVYRELHEKYQSLMEDCRRAMMENDGLRQQSEKLKTDAINYQKRVKFLQSRVKQLEGQRDERQRQWKGQMKRTVEEWRGNVDMLQKQLRKQQLQQGDSASNGTNMGQLKIRLIECETQLTHKISQVKSREEQVKSLKKQLQLKSQELSDILMKKDKQINELTLEVQAMQKKHVEKCSLYESQMKQLQVKIAKTQKQLNIKRLQLQQQKHASHPNTQNYLANLYPTAQSHQARQSLQQILSQQTQSLNTTKKQLNKSITENFTLKSELQQAKSTNNNLKQEVGILQMQYAALEKKIQQSKQTDMYVVKSQLQAANRRLKELQGKLEAKVREVKEKDQFIQAQFIRAEKRG